MPVKNKYDVIIIGAGPAGIFAALELVRHKRNDLSILILEKGRDIKRRVCPSREKQIRCMHCSPCATVCGWGGAGAFSDGKLTLSTEVGGHLDDYVGTERLRELIAYADGIYLDYGAPEKVYGGEHTEGWTGVCKRATLAGLRLVPLPIRHLGTGRTARILQEMHAYLSRHVEIRTGVFVASIITENDRVVGVETGDGRILKADYVVAAPGREGSEWLAGEARRLDLGTTVNPVDIGVRVELPAVVMEQLTASFYELKCTYVSKTFEDRVRTFCMNPYGEVVIENNDGVITVNGHSHAFNRTENTNFALLVSKNFTEPFRDPITYGRSIAKLANLLSGGVIVQRLGDLTSGRRSTGKKIKRNLVKATLEEAVPGDLSLVFPYRHLMGIVEMLKALDKIAPGIFARDTLLYGAEVKFYSSRLALSRVLETKIRNLFAAGDGAGVTRGLIQASAAGVVVAGEILRRV